jgi:hypothetical protein
VTEESLEAWLRRAMDASQLAVNVQLMQKVEVLEIAVRTAVAEALEESLASFVPPQPKETLLTADEAARLITSRLELAAAGGVGMPDFAALRTGGSVVHDPLLTTPDFSRAQMAPFDWVLHKLRIPGRAHLEPAEAAISKENQLGHCWAFEGSTGRITVKLARAVVPGAITLVHAPQASSPNAGVSAVDTFWVSGFVLSCTPK